MNLSKNILVALRSLPRRYVADGTMAVEYGPQPGCVFVMNGLKGLPPICYYPKLKQWKRVKFKAEPALTASPTALVRLGTRLVVMTPNSQHATKP